MDLQALFAAATEQGLVFEVDEHGDFYSVGNEAVTPEFSTMLAEHCDEIVDFLCKRPRMLAVVTAAMERVDAAWAITPADVGHLELAVSRYEIAVHVAFWRGDIDALQSVVQRWEDAANAALSACGCRRLEVAT